jgi:integrase
VLVAAALGLENWKRSVHWRESIKVICHENLRVHDLRHTYASLSRRAGADLRLLQKAMGHASITVTAHTYADLFDDELDDIASALDSLDDLQDSNIGA